MCEFWVETTAELAENPPTRFHIRLLMQWALAPEPGIQLLARLDNDPR